MWVFIFWCNREGQKCATHSLGSTVLENTIKWLRNVAVSPYMNLSTIFFLWKYTKRCYVKETTSYAVEAKEPFWPFSPRHNFHDATTKVIHWIMLSSESLSHISQNQQSSRKLTMLFTPFCCFCLKFPGLFWDSLLLFWVTWRADI